MLGNTFREYLARKRPFSRPSPSENTFERYLAMILGCLCVHECPLFPIPHLVSCSGTHVKSLHSASCLEPSQTRKRPRIEHSASRHKAASHSLDTGNGTLFATTQGTYLLQTPCVLGCFVGLSTPGGLQYAGSGRVGALVGVVDAGLLGGCWLRACRGACVAVGKTQLSRSWLRARQCARVTLSPYGRPQVCQISFGHVSLARARASAHETIRPFRPWPCEPFP